MKPALGFQVHPDVVHGLVLLLDELGQRDLAVGDEIILTQNCIIILGNLASVDCFWIKAPLLNVFVFHALTGRGTYIVHFDNDVKFFPQPT